MTGSTTARTRDELAPALDGPLLLPGDDGYDEEVTTINRSMNHAPEVVVGATRPEDVQAAVRFAAAHDLPVAVVSTGHGPSVTMEGGVMITTHRMTGVTVDPQARTMRVEAGVRWRQAADAAVAHGLAPLVGSSTTVGVVGYTLGGGLSVAMGRAFGWAADHARAIDVVTPDGELRHATAEREPDLFWALRGAKSNLGVVTAIEFDVFPVTRIYAGSMIFAGEDAARVLTAYRELAARAPEELMSSIAFVRMPAGAPVPPFMQGTLTLHVRISWIGAPADGARLIAPLRAAAPALADAVVDRPFGEFDVIAPGPPTPISSVEQFILLREMTAETADALLGAVGPDGDTELGLVDVRHLGGQLARRGPGVAPSAVERLDAGWLIITSKRVADRAGEEHKTAGLELREPLAPWLYDRRHANFLGFSDAPPESARTAYSDETYARLREIKAAVDPRNLFRLNHNVPPRG